MVNRFHLSVALRMLRVVLAVAILAALGFLGATFPKAAELTAIPAASDAAPVAPVSSAHSLEWYAPLWERDLKQPPLPPAPKPTPPAPVTPDVVPALLATFVESGGAYAHFLDPGGRLQLRTINDLVGGFRVTAIEPGRVHLADGSREVWLEVPHRKQP